MEANDEEVDGDEDKENMQVNAGYKRQRIGN